MSIKNYFNNNNNNNNNHNHNNIKIIYLLCIRREIKAFSLYDCVVIIKINLCFK